MKNHIYVGCETYFYLQRTLMKISNIEWKIWIYSIRDLSSQLLYQMLKMYYFYENWKTALFQLWLLQIG